MTVAARFFGWHRWLAYAIALQVLLWVVGGVVFAWLPFEDWVKGQQHVQRPQQAWPAGWAARLAAGLPAGEAVLSLQSVATAAGPALRLRLAGGGERWVGADGHELPPPDAAAVATFARSLYRGEGRALPLQALDDVPRRLGLVREVGAGRVVWLAAFDDRLQTRLYIDRRSGELLAVRNESWVWYDFFWRLHVMDYAGGEDFNNPWLRIVSPLALGLVLTGLVLLCLALRRRWRRRKG